MSRSGEQLDDQMNEMISYFTQVARRENEAHEAKINKVDISDRIALVGEISDPAVFGGSIVQVSGTEVTTVVDHREVNNVNLRDFKVRSARPAEFGVSQVESAWWLSDGRYAVVPKDGQEVRVGYKSPAADATHGLGEPNSYGFLGDGRFVHLDEHGVIRFDGEKSGLNGMVKRFLRRAIESPVRRIEVKDGLLLKEEVRIDGEFERFRTEPAIWIGGRPSDMDFSRSIVERNVMAEEDGGFVSKFRATGSGSNDTRIHRWQPEHVVAPRLHYGNFFSYAQRKRQPSTDMWGYTPLYDDVTFYTGEAKALGTQKVADRDYSQGALAVALDGRTGFVGKRDGSIEVIGLSGSVQTQSKVGPDYDSWISNDRRTAHFTVDWGGRDPYPWRRPPAEIVSWKAHEAPIDRLFAVGAELCSLATDGTLRRWQVS